LGSVHVVDAASVAFYRGDQRIAFFELRASVDNKIWTTMYAGQSRGDSNSRQVFTFGPLPARYLRYVGFGNSQNSFNSVTELLGHGK
ncbi:MAG: discoidin domain-containing protein, partial [Polyangiaceae bacterium]